MAWIGLADGSGGRFSPAGLGLSRGAAGPLPDACLRRGTLVIETRLPQAGRADRLFAFDAPGAGSLAIERRADGTISLRRGREVTNVAAPGVDQDTLVRISYTWDTGAGSARLNVEEPESAAAQSISVPRPSPLRLADARGMMLGGPGRQLSRNVVYAAISTALEPIGPQPSLMEDVPVATPRGYVRAGDLKRGDTVLTDTAGVVPVLHRIDRLVPARGSFQPVRLYAPYFGLRQDIVVAPTQRLVIDGSEVEYLFGREAVLVTAGHLLNGQVGRVEPVGPVVRMVQLILPGHETILTAGTWAESLYLGRMRRDAGRVSRSVLAGLDRAHLPEHAQRAHTALRRIEAVTLADQRAA